MHHLSNFIDLKVSLLLLMFTAVSYSDVELSIKLIGFVIYAGYNLDRWYRLRKNNKE